MIVNSLTTGNVLQKRNPHPKVGIGSYSMANYTHVGQRGQMTESHPRWKRNRSNVNQMPKPGWMQFWQRTKRSIG
jgi:hypothetical protein